MKKQSAWHTVPAVSRTARPSRDEQSEVEPGMLVKFTFIGQSLQQKGMPHAERMWVKVTRVNDDGSVRGRLMNEPVAMTELHHGAVITVPLAHMIPVREHEGVRAVNDYAVVPDGRTNYTPYLLGAALVGTAGYLAWRSTRSAA